MSTPAEILDDAQRYVKDNIVALCKEALELENGTPMRQGGKFHGLIEKLRPLYSVPLPLAQALIKHQAMCEVVK